MRLSSPREMAAMILCVVLAALSFVCVGLFQGMLVTAIGAHLTGDAAPVAVPRRTHALGRIAVGALALVALPGFLGAVTDIL